MAVHAKKADYREAFEGLAFPVSKVGVVTKSRMRGGLDREVFAVVAALPNRRFASLEDLEGAVRQVYLARGAAPEEVPV